MTKIVPPLTPERDVQFYSSAKLKDWDYQVLRAIAAEVPTGEIEGKDTKADIAFFLAHNYTADEIENLRNRVE